MKTKILLSIMMLVLMCDIHANGSIPMDSIRYAMEHPGTTVVIADSVYFEYSSNWLWETEYRTRQVVVYENGNFSQIFNQTTASSPRFCWWMTIFVVLGVIASFFIPWWESGVVIPAFVLISIVFENDHVSWWVPVVVLIMFIGVERFGRYIKKKNQKNKEE
jgi:hypothetical protein